MGMSLARLVLEGHRRAGEPPWTNTRGEETWRVRVDHVVVGAERGALSLAAFHGLSLPRIRAELALASPDRVGGSPGPASERRWFQAAQTNHESSSEDTSTRRPAQAAGQNGAGRMPAPRFRPLSR